MSENDPVIAPVVLSVPGLSPPLAMQVHGDRDQFVSRKIRQDGIWEPFESTLVLAFLKPGGVFVDVGANIGYFSLLAAQAVGEGGKVIAFEPDPENFRLIGVNCALNKLTGQVEVVEAGLAAGNRAGRLYLSEDNLGDHQIYAGADERESLEIRLLNGSEFLRPRLTRMDLLKIDTQGAEYEVIAGLMPLLQSFEHCPRIIIELTPFSLRAAGSSGRQLIDLLAQLEQPWWIIDHIEHRLAASTAAELAQWCDNVDTCEGDEGFMNIMLGPRS